MRIGFIVLKIFTLLIYGAIIVFFGISMLFFIVTDVTLNMPTILGIINLIIFISIFFMTLFIRKESKKLNSITFILSILNVFISNTAIINPLIAIIFCIFSFIFFSFSNLYINSKTE